MKKIITLMAILLLAAGMASAVNFRSSVYAEGAAGFAEEASGHGDEVSAIIVDVGSTDEVIPVPDGTGDEAPDGEKVSEGTDIIYGKYASTSSAIEQGEYREGDGVRNNGGGHYNGIVEVTDDEGTTASNVLAYLSEEGGGKVDIAYAIVVDIGGEENMIPDGPGGGDGERNPQTGKEIKIPAK